MVGLPALRVEVSYLGLETSDVGREWMERGLDVVVWTVGDATFIRPEGVLDLKGAAAFEQEVRATLRAAPAEILVDLGGVSFLDSIGLRALFRACEWCDRERVALCMVAGGAPVQRILRMTGADMQLPLVEGIPRRLR